MTKNTIKWLNRDNVPKLSQIGNYIIENDRISISIKNEYRESSYIGTILNNNQILMNGKTKYKYYRLTYKVFDHDSELIKDSFFYPIIHIPKRIKESAKNIIDKKEIFEYLDITIEKPKLLSEPTYPSKTEFREIEKIKFNEGGCLAIATIPMNIFFIVMTFYSFVHRMPILGIVFAFASILFINNFWKTYRVKTYKNEELTNDEYKLRLDNYYKELERIRITNIKIQNDYESKLNDANNTIIGKEKEINYNIYLEHIKPFSSIKSNKDNLKRGKSELLFLTVLYEKFGNQIKTDSYLDMKNISYQPDFVFICKETGLHIDIEIDEPYTLSNNSVIHHIGSKDIERDIFFLNQNWCVIRFSEEQIIRHTSECLNLIDDFIQSIRRKDINLSVDIQKYKRWNYEEGLIMLHNKTRMKY